MLLFVADRHLRVPGLGLGEGASTLAVLSTTRSQTGPSLTAENLSASHNRLLKLGAAPFHFLGVSCPQAAWPHSCWL